MRDMQLRSFYTVANEGSIRKAAEKLSLAASALSRRITQIEEDLGVPLFERHARGLKLTDAGRIYYDHARQTLLNEEWAVGEIEAIKDLRRGQIRIFCVEGAIGSILTDAIAEFRPGSPGVKLFVNRAGSTGVVRSVAADEVDLGLAFDPPLHRDVMVLEAAPAPLYAVFSHVFSFPHKAPKLADLADYPLAIPPDSSYGLRDVIDRVARKRADIQLQVPLQCDSIFGLVGFALSGQGVSILPKCSFINELSDERLMAVPLQDPPLRDAQLALLARRHRTLPSVTRRFSEILAKRLRESPS
ncbi:LysR family transcriptional regulator [Billgrantia kenyensis]|uniref:LysR family transcriptional regulator n=1 Tax=Billgrantia kenyensis TaxID=321266 RepID=A0A7V9VZT8_9GAMM|nr:LysR family transcriptional regulator [Halomonas kenyensis]MBA2778426.1 LysR family transcriptional regulator [Halomonas kenyensis]MCG6660732.1 LysR family transcriptional regulator [Halomonas kenyensis]